MSWEAMKANGWRWEAMSLHIMFGALIFWIRGFGDDKKGIANAAKVCQNNNSWDTCLTWRGMNSPALAALDDASKMPFKAPFQ